MLPTCLACTPLASCLLFVPLWRETVSQCRMVIARRLSGVVAISCIRLLRRLLQSLLLLHNDITTQSEGVGGGCLFMLCV